MCRAKRQVSCDPQQPVIGKAPGVDDDLAVTVGKLVGHQLRAEALDGLRHNDLIAIHRVLSGDRAPGVIAHEKALLAGIGPAAGAVVLPVYHAADNEIDPVDLNGHAGEIRAAEQLPGQLPIQHDPVGREIVFADVAAADEMQRVKFKKLSANGKGRRLGAARVPGDRHFLFMAPGVNKGVDRLVPFEPRRRKGAEHRIAEGIEIAELDGGGRGQEAADLYEALLVVPAPAFVLLLGEELFRAQPGRRTADEREDQQRRTDGKPYSLFPPCPFHLIPRPFSPGRRS